MIKRIIPLLAGILLMQTAWAVGTRYDMRVDGLACPFCAYGVEKKLKAIEGTSDIHVDLDKGLVSVTVSEGKELTEEQMKKLFTDSGFTYRSMKKTPVE